MCKLQSFLFFLQDTQFFQIVLWKLQNEWRVFRLFGFVTVLVLVTLVLVTDA